MQNFLKFENNVNIKTRDLVLSSKIVTCFLNEKNNSIKKIIIEKDICSQLSKRFILTSQRAIYNQYNQEIIFDKAPMLKSKENSILQADSINYNIDTKKLEFNDIKASFKK